jgi:hypothetical protein
MSSSYSEQRISSRRAGRLQPPGEAVVGFGGLSCWRVPTSRPVNIFDPTSLGLIALGVILSIGTYRVALWRSADNKLAAGFGGLAALVWFMLITDWLPPAWKTFWAGHSITAGGITGVLGIVVAWAFVDVRRERHRTNALYGNWSNWLQGQTRSVAELVDAIERLPDGTSAFDHLLRAATTRSALMVQQQWVASAYTVFVQRDTEHENGLMNGLSDIRKHGGLAIQQLTALELTFQRLGDAPVPREVSEAMWDQGLVALINLRDGLGRHEDFVTISRFEVMA